MPNISLAPYLPTGLSYISSVSPSIEAAATNYGVNAAAIAGAIALEQNNAAQFSFTYNFSKLYAGAELSLFSLESSPSNSIAQDYAQAVSSGTITPSGAKKAFNIVYLDMGPAKIRLELAIQLVTNNPDDPAFSPYANNLY